MKNKGRMGEAETDCQPPYPPSATLSYENPDFVASSASFAARRRGVRVGRQGAGVDWSRAITVVPFSLPWFWHGLLQWGQVCFSPLRKILLVGKKEICEGTVLSSFLGHCHVSRWCCICCSHLVMWGEPACRWTLMLSLQPLETGGWIGSWAWRWLSSASQEGHMSLLHKVPSNLENSLFNLLLRLPLLNLKYLKKPETTANWKVVLF